MGLDSSEIKKRNYKKEQLVQLGVALAIIVLISIASQYLFTRIDLTSDKRYTLSDHTKEMMKELDDVVYFKIYLDGELPASFMRLQNASIELIHELKAYGGDNIQYEIIDPAESSDEKTRNEIFKQLYEKGLDPTNLNVKEKDGSTSQKYIVPGVMVSYHGQEVPVNILKNNLGFTPEANLNSSIQSLEYEFTFAIQRLTNKIAPRIGFVGGHGELSDMEIDDLAASLSQYYRLARVYIDDNVFALRDTLGRNRYELLVIAKPETEFSEQDKFLIDQYIMHGGSTLWLIDRVKTNLDSLAYSRSTLAFPNDIKLDDQLFTYGVRINPNLIQDMQCAVIPVNNSMPGQKPNFVPAPWVYFPLATPAMNHPLRRNLDMVKTQFASAIDFVGEGTALKKTVLLTSSPYSRTVVSPVLIDLSMINEQLTPERYNKANLSIGVMLEGQFKSVYTNRIPPSLARNGEIDFKDKSQSAKMIILSDGDIMRNHVKGVGENQQSLALGFDRFTKQTFGNKEFLLNCVNYLSGHEALMEARSKEYKLRLLDQAKLKEQKVQWQLINVLLPIVIILLMAFGANFWRKKQFTK